MGYCMKCELHTYLKRFILHFSTLNQTTDKKVSESSIQAFNKTSENNPLQ